MKALLVLILALASASAGIVGCAHRPRRTDWRTQPAAAAVACASDADCSGAGTCAIELGASQGTCSGGAQALPPGQGGDGGAGAPRPNAPNIQPSSSDIHL